MNDALGYYRVLDVATDADVETIRLSYRNKAKVWHPDSNPSAEAVDMFRKLSEAYEVLSDEKMRLYYDILSLGCNAGNYPDIKNLTLAKDKNEDVNLRVVAQIVNRANFLSYSSRKEIMAMSYSDAIKANFNNSKINWLQGWWHIKTAGKNLTAIVYNFMYPVDKKESLRMLLINMLLHLQNGQTDRAVQCGWQACDYLSSDGQQKIKEFIGKLNINVKRPRPWNLWKLRLAQIILPLSLLLVFGVLYGYSQGWMAAIFAPKTEINYYQNVELGNNDRLTDDIVVGKVINIPVDKSDEAKLYHLEKDSLIMYGPSDKFDVLKKAAANMTVRLTGLTPDNVWARIMIDNGEMGFVRFKVIKQGRGDEIPFGSKIIE